MTDAETDPIRRTAEIVNPEDPGPLERRLKQDIIASIGRIKPAMVEDVDFEADVMTGNFFVDLPAPIQGIAIARCEGALAFYNRVGWHPKFLETDLAACVPDENIDTMRTRYHARHLHDLAYVHPKHFEKMLGKPGAASLWETLKRWVSTTTSSTGDTATRH